MAKIRIEPKPESKHEGNFATLGDAFRAKRMSREEYDSFKAEAERIAKIEAAQNAEPLRGVH